MDLANPSSLLRDAENLAVDGAAARGALGDRSGAGVLCSAHSAKPSN